MAHYAFLNADNEVVEVITGKDESEAAPEGYADWEEYYLSKRPGYIACKRTSYNTIGNQHTDGGTPFRGNYAGIGYTYDSANDIFLPEKPYASWILDTNISDWKAPLDLPADSNEVRYQWNEEAYQADNTTGWDFVLVWSSEDNSSGVDLSE